MNVSRRDFLKKAGVVGVAAGGGMFPDLGAAAYSRIAGANDRIRTAVIGVNSRGNALAQNFAAQPQCEIVTVCDVDRRAIEKCAAKVKEIQNKTPKGEKDFRRVLEDKNVDAAVIAMPDHWHAPAALLALQAGKHVYLEKPVSHNPREGEMLMEAAARYGKILQVGTQRRSWPKVREAIRQVQDGAIGKVHFGKGWYVNNRPGIGVGKVTAAPDWLDWELWQGPAPRTAYRDNIVHYNWHWFWRWGTAETLNNGTHMIDLLCWGMNLEYPTRISSTGGRYFYRDDWETPDTQTVGMQFGDKASLLWEGYSCSGKPIEGSPVGVIFYGEAGSLYIAGGNEYRIFDKKGKLVSEVKSDIAINPQNQVSPAQQLDAIHIVNFFDAIQKGTPQNVTIRDGHQCTLLMQLANISFRRGKSLDIDPSDGHIIGDAEAQRFWSRSYEPGWEPKA
ncbi:MAG: Gfo/Idh/MocA family oxidoreductase [Tannerella sp.]|jgi:predicted dehydrogenase|nr:Gfo/Idh/MocA family oxidoreductase [Tannerella sp.]